MAVVGWGGRLLQKKADTPLHACQQDLLHDRPVISSYVCTFFIRGPCSRTRLFPPPHALLWRDLSKQATYTATQPTISGQRQENESHEVITSYCSHTAAPSRVATDAQGEKKPIPPLQALEKDLDQAIKSGLRAEAAATVAGTLCRDWAENWGAARHQAWFSLASELHDGRHNVTLAVLQGLDSLLAGNVGLR